MIKVWEGWNLIDQDYRNGLEYTLLKKKKKSEEKFQEKNILITKELELYEDDLLEIVSENPNKLRNFAIIH